MAWGEDECGEPAGGAGPAPRISPANIQRDDISTKRQIRDFFLMIYEILSSTFKNKLLVLDSSPFKKTAETSFQFICSDFQR